jgi:antirestriction protein ArdC
MAKMSREQKKTYGKQKSDEMSERWFNAIADGIKSGNIPWRKPWNGGASGMPQNLKSKKTYRGGNLMGLWFSAMAAGFSDLRFATRNQLKEAGMSIAGLKNGTGFPIRFFKPNTYEKENERGEVEVRSGYVTRWYEVWCVEQCEGYEAPPVSDSHQPVPVHEMMSNFNTYVESQPTLTLNRGGNRAFYRLNGDTIQLPVHEAFTDSLGEVMTAFHEAVHSTGHPQRCERDLKNSFGSPEYALEELVAELGSMLTVVRLGGEFKPDAVMEENANNIAYLQSWLKACNEQDKALTAAFGQAQAASDYIVSYCQSEVVE